MIFIKKNYDDSEVREFGKKFVKEVFDILLECHPNQKAIDLISTEDESFGVELERGGWSGNFWESDYSMITGIGFRTINVPMRKAKYWYDRYGDKLFPNKNKHWFIRTNKDFTQVILIKPNTIKNKVIFTEFKPNNSKENEKWMSFKREDVQTYNFKENKWKIETKN